MNRILLYVAPCALMMLTEIGMAGVEHWLSAFGKNDVAKQMLGRTGIALPYVVASLVGIVFLFAAAGSPRIRSAGWGVFTGAIATLVVAGSR